MILVSYFKWKVKENNKFTDAVESGIDAVLMLHLKMNSGLFQLYMLTV